jgi:uncharacterized membrane protein HdeD (DUF308 family)
MSTGSPFDSGEAASPSPLSNQAAVLGHPASQMGQSASGLGAPVHEMTRVLAQNWWAVALRGVCGILFGVIALAAPIETMLTLALLFAGYLLADGVFGIVAAVRATHANGRWSLLLTEAVLNIVMGVTAALFPGGAVLAFVLVTGIWALFTGGLILAAAFRMHVSHGRWWLALSGVLSLVWGVLLVLTPLTGAIVLTWWLGIYALLFGVLLLALGLRLRRVRAAGLERLSNG